MARTTTSDDAWHVAERSFESDLAEAAERRGRARHGAADRSELDDSWGTGRVGRIARALFDHDEAADAVAGSRGVETLERRADRNRRQRAVVLHDRRIPGSGTKVDHIVVAPSGVWVVDAVVATGKIVQRNVGGWFKQEPRLLLADADQSGLLAAIARKSEGIERSLDSIAMSRMTVDRAVCFTAAEWPRLFPKPMRIADVWVTWPSSLVEMIVADGPLDVDEVHAAARHLDESFRPASR